MSEKQTPKTETFEFKAEMKQLLHLIIHSLYTHEEIFLRELISNSSDALNKIRFRMLTDRDVLDADVEQKIDILLNKDSNTLTLTDTGVGMTRDDLMKRIGTVASSGTLDFVNELKNNDGPVDAQMIGQFGVGFYSAFMVADEITVDTRHANADSVGLRWKSDGSGSYTIEETEQAERGTTITLHLKEDKGEFAEDWRIKQIIKKYSNFVDFPVHLEGEEVNTVDALWQKSKSEVKEEELNEFYKFISGDFDDSMGHLHLSLEGKVSFKALLFIPKKAPKGLYQEDFKYGVHLYSSNVFIQDDARNLLPDWARFVKGVVDTEDLPLNVSREVTQNSPVLAKIRQILTGKILGMLKEWSVEDSDRYDNFTREFGMLFKSGLSMDFDNRDQMLELVRFESSAKEAGEYVSLEQYVDRMQPEQKAIYYVLAESRQAAEMNPNLEYFKANDIEVLLMSEPVDAFIAPSIPTYKDHDLKSVETSDLDLKKSKKKKGAPTKKESEGILDRFKKVLGDKVEDVKASDRLVDSAATLVVGKEGMDTQMERMMKMMDENFEGAKKVLEINLTHPLVINLIALRDNDEDGSLVDSAILQVYEGALLSDGSLTSPQEFVKRMTELMVQATGK
ncbi:MAG: molecular chaperone HtpG [Bacteroidetes Order II. Incertae sedis bacterium]|jgi:molecular chaperone HtpG|nr:molecular chaperone HtpG [Bacteroidetes Order II. bacterium]MBT4603858.1 molecular chaperone HtpG [Bacteroidetes Order II. bacterium]MBT5249229.1 molecular chaperone HtpG [Bacteroidetes Order II. bacterium]MBT6199591.1 molecular chaperone HtpG [Bacteroidetes Order II. bacterium]MBT6424862.1 molecular chaperone HtpG [Bacteroidetes Order II. bacterium]